MKRGNWLILSSLVIAGLLLASCAPAVAPTPKPALPAPTPKPAVEQPRYGGTLYISHFADPISYDPIQEASVQSISLIIPCYSGIVQHDPLEPTKVIGDLAEKWDMSPDGMSYTFYLHKNVKWHDGTPFTVEDARFSLEVVRKPPKGVVSPKVGWLKAADKIEALDKDTLRITLKYPSASFLHNLGDGRMVAVPKHVFEAKESMKKDVVGTGPYKFKSFTPGASWSVVKNHDYFIKGRPYLDGITWYVIRDSATRFAALRTHRVQLLPLGSLGLTPSQAEIIRKEMSEKIPIHKYPSLNFQAFWMLHTKSPWNDIRVRRAVDMAIDRPKVIKTAAEDVADLAGYMPTGIWSLPEAELLKMPGYRQPKDADIAEAKKLLAEAGYPQGFKTTTLTRGDAPLWERCAITIKDQLAQIGIDVTVKLYDQATLTDLAYKRAFDTTVFAGTSAYDDADQVFGMQFITGVPRNYSEFSDEKVDKWYDEQGRTLDPAKRKEIVLNMQRRMHELIPSSMLFWLVHEMGVWKEVRDYKPGIGLYNNLKFQNVWLAQ